ncbi:xylanase/chitin deacetylase [Fictibacillus macauensis ZFHKF-1]|uniref:Xylanase/chitin deacetylase n=1 Tax=Fictibacillus macauensis ZFHKF-1 TaxID=1196324 RepID=I8J5J4_9BACL|nr:polysaccharide deacetylase family protein [Fictibacillus macauensis]EIT87071.1 xylanase/chitin deacetylase [Fictibacillus macauensis ZFHKF-1]
MWKQTIVSGLVLTSVLAGCSSQEDQHSQKVTKPTPIHDQKKEPAKKTIDTSSWQATNGPAKLPILMYHSISSGNTLRVPKAEFAKQMKWLHAHDYATLSPEEAYRVFTENKKPKKKAVLITFDDGYGDNFTDALPILKRYHMKATVFMIGDLIGKHHHLTKQQLQQMADANISIQSHTMAHQELNTLAPARQKNEMIRSKRLFNKLMHQQTIMLSYPVGRYTDQTVALAQATGYKMAVTTHPGIAMKKDGMQTLPRVRISPGMSEAAFAGMLKGDQ